MAKEKIQVRDVIPDPTLFGKLGARSKALPNVVTELVDNSLDSWILMPDSKKARKSLEIRIQAGSTEGSWFTVTDNAGGMTLDELQGAMTIALSSKGALEETTKKKLLGFYGFGLKSAAMFIGDYFRIFTQSYLEKGLVHVVEFDKDKFEGADPKSRWKLSFKTISANQAAKQEIFFKHGHGTVVQIKNKRYRPASQYGITERLRRTFAPRLPCDARLESKNQKFSYEKIFIYFITKASQAASAKPLTALGPFYTVWENDRTDVEKHYSSAAARFRKEKSRDALAALVDTDALKGKKSDGKANHDEAVLPKLDWIDEIPAPAEIKEVKIDGKRIFGRIGILDRGMAHTSEYGFDLIKNGRVIETSVKDPEKKKEQFVGLVANNHNARIVGQLFLDDWPTDHQKTEFIKDVPGWSDPEGLKKLKKSKSSKKQDSNDENTSIAKLVYRFLKENEFLAISQKLQSPRKAIPGAEELEDPAEKVIGEKLSDAAPDIDTQVSRSARSEGVKAALNKLGKPSPPPKPPKDEPEDEPKPVANTKLQATKSELTYGKLGPEKPLLTVKPVEDKKYMRLLVTVNLNHPFVASRESGELKALGQFLACEALAAYMAQEKLVLGPGYEKFISLRDELLRGSR